MTAITRPAGIAASTVHGDGDRASVGRSAGAAAAIERPARARADDHRGRRDQHGKPAKPTDQIQACARSVSSDSIDSG